MTDEKKGNVIHLPTQANLKHAFEKGRQQGEADAQALIDNPPTPQQLLKLCCEVTKYELTSPAREYLNKALELLHEHFNGGDPSAYYSDPKRIGGCVFVLGIHIQLRKSEETP